MTALEDGSGATDVAVLAHLARETLAAAQGGTLHIHGLSTGGSDDPTGILGEEAGGVAAVGLDVLFYDDDGRPTFLCPPNSPVSTAASRHRPAVLSIQGPHEAPATVILAGHLDVVGAEDVRGEPVLLVGLLPHSVVVEHDDPASPTIAQHSVPLSAWTAATPDPIAPAAAKMTAHTNRSHAEELRAFVAGLRGLPESEIIAAEIVDLDVHGVGLSWLDSRGAHTARVRFPEPAHCPATLAAALRETLAHP